ncbi:head decoration protein [Breoghania sp. L-A4]|uniref:head decoration protein n=1 Tax=Breoghania sp. L-A4 TaxID=2304600 RepID=UPI000E3607FF|nr:head decoration protein [Breoghania sp. L-A4]AXS39260.1 head decoration protein [Breoghania sp. L-A4]
MDIKTEGARDLGFVLSLASGKRSLDTITIASGAGRLESGTVLGRITASGKFITSPNAEVVDIEGAEIATAILGYGVDATDSDVEAVVVDGDAEVKEPMLVFDASVDDATKIAIKVEQLRAVGIKAR